MNHEPSLPAKDPAFPEIILLGIKTLLSEWKWIGLNVLRQLEMRQMKKRLREEYMILGQLQTKNDGTTAKDLEDQELSRKQISFLQDEIDYLEKELDKTRNNFIAKRIRSWNL